MKTPLVILASVALALPSSAAFATWTNQEGKSLEMELVEVTAEGDETVGVFVMRNGKKAILKKSTLSEESAKQFDALAPSSSVFDVVLNGNLIKFYNEHKTENFEIVLISSDSDVKSMESYAAKNKMPWPQLKFDQLATFKGKFNHGVSGIPSVIVCDLKGNIVTRDGRDLAALEQLVK